MKILNANAFGKLIRLTRKKSQLTQEVLAATSGLGVRFVRDLENGKPTCQLEKSLRVARMLGISLDAVLPTVLEKDAYD